MRTRAPGAALTMVKLDLASGVPLYRQLCEGVRQAILTGSLAAGTRLPATRELTKELGVSRNTVMAAFEQLTADGYILAKPGSGAYVAEKMMAPERPPRPLVAGPEPEAPVRPAERPQAPSRQPPSETLSAASPNQTMRPTPRPSIRAELPLSKLYRPGPTRPFRTGVPDWREFPLDVWERLRARVLQEKAATLLNTCDPSGYLPL